jgi:hypothetical protein
LIGSRHRVDEALKKRLAELKSQAVNLTDLFTNPEWVTLAAELEDACDVTIEAGYTGANLDKLLLDPEGFMRMKQIQSIVARELRRWLTELNLGIGTDAALACARKIVLERLTNPSVEIQTTLESVMDTEEFMARLPLPADVQADVRVLLQQAITAEDWEAIAQAASQSVHRLLIEQTQIPQIA